MFFCVPLMMMSVNSTIADSAFLARFRFDESAIADGVGDKVTGANAVRKFFLVSNPFQFREMAISIRLSILGILRQQSILICFIIFMVPLEGFRPVLDPPLTA